MKRRLVLRFNVALPQIVNLPADFMRFNILFFIVFVFYRQFFIIKSQFTHQICDEKKQ